MMRVLIELWPALVPLALYLLLMHARRGKAKKTGADKPRFRDGPWFWAVIASIGVAIACLLLVGMSADSVKGAYEPPHMENGQIVPGQVKQ